MKKLIGYGMQGLAAVEGLSLLAGKALAQTDLTGTLTSVNGYWTTAEGIGIAIILFVVGRKVVKKI